MLHICSSRADPRVIFVNGEDVWRWNKNDITTKTSEIWANLEKYLPAFQRAKAHTEADLKTWLEGGKLNRNTLKNLLRTVMVWVSWIHEDVGHSAAAYVYNGEHTPMCIPEDGEGIPLKSFTFNAAAYRGFVFLHRATLLEEPPAYWFKDGKADAADKKCYTDFQAALTELGASDPAFSECDTDGFYSCVNRVETAVSS